MLLDARHGDVAGLVGNESAADTRDRGALGRPDREYGQRKPAAAQIARDPLGRRRPAAIRNQQYLSDSGAGLLQQLPPLVDRGNRVAAAARHDVSAEAVDQGRDRIGVRRQRRNRECIRRIHDQRCLAAAATLEYVEYLEPRTHQPARRHVLCVHGP